jgi:class 3 adenylate cyclase/pimeloyl-ACP methyl ester carboxylesterase
MAKTPEVHYAKNGDAHIAYQVMGSGPFDLVLLMGFISHLDLVHENPWILRFLERLSSFCRLILFDKRGTGLSDRVSAMPTLEERMNDVRAVMDAVGSERAALFGYSEGGPMSILLSATYPQRTSAMILHASMARMAWAPDNPWGRTDEELEARSRSIEEHWGQGKHRAMYAQSLVGNDEYKRWFARFERGAASPGAALALLRMNMQIDVRPLLPIVSVPTLVLHRTGDRMVKVEHGRYIAQHIQGAKYVELPGEDHAPWAGDVDAICDEIQAFLTGARSAPKPDRVLATVLFTDIVSSTQRAAELGDRAWKELLREHDFLVRRQIERHRGREIKSTGDGFLATFDAPARAVLCGQAIADVLKSLNIQVRVGVHVGECEVIGEDLGGIAVHIGARVMAHAGPDEILVSSTVKDLVAGSGLRFESRGAHTLKGVPGDWALFAAI